MHLHVSVIGKCDLSCVHECMAGWLDLVIIPSVPSASLTFLCSFGLNALCRYVHHLTSELKDLVTELQLEVPLLSPHFHQTCTEDQGNMDEVKERVCRSYQEQITCASCHSRVPDQ